MKIELPDRPHFLPWLPKGGLLQVYGPRGIGKSHFTLGLAISLTMGERFLKWDVTEATGVMIIDGEMARGDLRERIRKSLPGKPCAPLDILSHEQVFRTEKRDLNLGIEEFQERLKSHFKDRDDIGVIILDNLSCLLPGVAEDKRDDWAQKVMPLLLWFKRRGISVLMVHHAGKGGRQRGTSAREDSLDTVINLRRVPGHDATDGAQFEIVFEKSRGVHGDDVASIEARLGTDQDGQPAWTWSAVEENNETRLLNLVRDGIESQTEAAEELGISKGQVSKLKKKLVDKGLLKKQSSLALA